MNKTLLAKLSLTAALTAVTFFPIITLSARESGGGYHGGSSHTNYNHNYNSNTGNHGNYGNHREQNYNHGGYGGYNGGYGGYGGVVNPYPEPGSQPGMTDDSNDLYQSYLRHNNTGY
ncbi:MAG: hypothetical protein H0W50_00780 [Parachlamydiaceae bacterium]|nr:hypothetical protein [Parachlamydiaceae bacterium]